VALEILNRISTAEASFGSNGSGRRYRGQPFDLGVIAPAGGPAESPAQVRKLA
jgi:hypothetical protein